MGISNFLSELVDAPSNQGYGDLNTIGRDSIISFKLKLGNQRYNPERVLAVHEKFYKWWMRHDKKPGALPWM